MNEVIIELLLPIYIDIVPDLYWGLRRYLRSLLGNLRIDDIYVVEFGPRFTKIKLRGSDAQIASTFLTKLFGTRISIMSLRYDNEYSGRVLAINEDNIVIDIGISDKEVFIRIPLEHFLSSILTEHFRRKRIQHKHNKHTKLINVTRFLGISKYFPFTVKIIKEQIQQDSNTIYGTPGERTVRLFKKWIESMLDRVIVYGATRSQIERAIRKSKSVSDIIGVERLGFLEHAIICKKTTSAQDLIRKVGPFLWGVKLMPFSPKRILT